MSRALLVAMSLCAVTACSDSSDAVPSASPVNTLGLRDFTRIQSTGPDNVIVSVGKDFAVKADGSDRALKVLEIKVVNGELRIGRREGWANMFGGMDEGATIHVAMPAINGVGLTGSGDVDVDRAQGSGLDLSLTGSGNLKIGAAKVGALTADVTGSGNIALTGTADSAKLSSTGSGDVDGKGLKAGRASVSVLGSGNVGLASDGPVDISIMGSGDVDVKGRAQCKVSAMGSGEAHCAA
ncbi:head GIN domain-containing protein [Sphingobium phenoxybenzoativorans]|uniref:head GIN domain-containing protein n=1 Tax=Sphingobium phenoxybenzoativorans TaxID=1592790 RepID=UPI0008723A87|nr:head GIN domain-containing protein [Sphingobium phenoxybenzoativorans]